MKTLIFGANGGLGSELMRLYPEALPIDRYDFDFEAVDIWAENRFENFLHEMTDVELIINTVGTFAINSEAKFNTIFDVNVKSTWMILQHYIKHKPINPIKIITIGSSAYSHGRKDYILYAASKAALHNMIEGATEFFENTNVTVGIYHPPKMKTSMIHYLPPAQQANAEDPCDVALAIKEYVGNLTK